MIPISLQQWFFAIFDSFPGFVERKKREMFAARNEYKQWPFLDEEEFDLACAYFDRRYVRANLGPNRQVFKIRHRRALITNTTYVEILRLLQPPDGDDELSNAFARLGNEMTPTTDTKMAEAEEEDQVMIPRATGVQYRVN